MRVISQSWRWYFRRRDRGGWAQHPAVWHGLRRRRLRQVQAVIGLDPNHVTEHSVLASLYFQRQQHELARQHAEKATRLGAPVERLLETLRRAPGQAR
jgi:hypothetical protein